MNGYYGFYPPPHMLHHLPVMAMHCPPPHPSLCPDLRAMGMQYNTNKTFYDYLIVVDFEATCEETPKDFKHRPIRSDRPEIIQFPAVLVDVRNEMIVDCFDSYVRPVEKPILSEFCKNLTGITQEQVNQAQDFPTVLKRFEKWLKNHGLSNHNQSGRTFAIVADGSYDIGHFLFKQCVVSHLPFPAYARRWVNIRTTYWKNYKLRWFSLKAVLEEMGERFEGRQHNGLDDAKNISKVLLKILREGGVVVQTERVLLDSREQEKNEIKIMNDKRGTSKFDLATVKPVYNGSECVMVMMPSGSIVLRVPPDYESLDLHYPTEVNNKENSASRFQKKNSNERKNVLKNKRKDAAINTNSDSQTDGGKGDETTLGMIPVSSEE